MTKNILIFLTALIIIIYALIREIQRVHRFSKIQNAKKQLKESEEIIIGLAELNLNMGNVLNIIKELDFTMEVIVDKLKSLLNSNKLTQTNILVIQESSERVEAVRSDIAIFLESFNSAVYLTSDEEFEMLKEKKEELHSILEVLYWD